ncbi:MULTISPECIES: carboxymuconolactone decarboxylase family protein [unclassified Pseudomonas]|jgi:4-carboxymuconolactone decarboxylase|uniref:carboxymuconolactone decarboxylase family protein n=1 Tax=unclassified Pseudomonas TaxID=196821 RepID=UPI000C2FAA8C|nr:MULTISPECIES: carboxymuconolactone decarboxylase family protein [unclassified Pseudomonas]MCU1737506.1 carboxymuconolactone decarboxylase family protein [Pseudomonas sp. 20S_6.2_Bac1]
MNSKDPVATLYREGRKQFIEWVPGGGARLDALFHTAPALGELAVGVVYGYLHQRPGLDPRLREAATFAAIVAAGMVGAPLSVHFKTGLASGLAPGEYTELLLQVSAFTGFPRAVETADQLNQLFADADMPSPPARTPRAVTLAFCEAVREGHGAFPISPEARALLRKTHQFQATATAADRVLLECYQQDQPVPRGVLQVRVDGEQIVAVTLFSPE